MMKFLSILAAASLALTPVSVSAGSGDESTESTDNGRPISGPLAGRALDQPIPAGAILAGGLILFGGAILCLLACDGDGDSDSQTVTNSVEE